MTNNIVNVNVSQVVAPAPNILQRTGALVSQGATTLDEGDYQLLTQLSDLTAILKTAGAITSMLLSTGVVTVTTTSAHGLPIGNIVPVTIAGVTPSAYNGNIQATITGTNVFTYPLGGSPGVVTVQGTYIPGSVAEVLAMGTTFFAQGSSLSVYVLELAAGDAEDGVASMTTFLTGTPGVFYSFLVPRLWSVEADFFTLAGNHAATTSKLYFFATTSIAAYAAFATASDSTKSIFGVVEAVGIPATEFSAAAMFWVSLHYQPSTSNRVTPMAFAYVVGVTDIPTAGNSALFTALKTAGLDWVGTGAEGGISNKIIYWGTTMDGRDFTYWYSVDWAQINIQLDLANEIINGSNNPLAPLYYDQPGIDRLQARAQGTTDRGISFGLILGPALVDAVKFSVYVVENPSDYPLGVYNGLSLTYTPQRGFKSITFNITVTDFPVA